MRKSRKKKAKKPAREGKKKKNKKAGYGPSWIEEPKKEAYASAKRQGGRRKRTRQKKRLRARVKRQKYVAALRLMTGSESLTVISS